MPRKKPFEANGVSHLAELRQKAGEVTAPCDDDFRGKYPLLFSYLYNNRLAEDKAIEPLCLRVTVSGGDWCFALSSSALGAYGDVMARTFDLGLAEVEQRLGNNSFPWKFNQKREPKIRTVRGPG